jgi:hypothetical protein
VDLVEAVERVADDMRKTWGFLITDDAINYFRKEYDHDDADAGLKRGTINDVDAAAYHLTLDATDSEINDALAEIPTRRAGR